MSPSPAAQLRLLAADFDDELEALRASGVSDQQIPTIAGVGELLLRLFRVSAGQGGSIPGLSAVPADDAGMRLLLDLRTAAAVLGVSEPTAKRLVADGELPSVKVKGRRLVRRADLEQFVGGLPTEGSPRLEAVTGGAA